MASNIPTSPAGPSAAPAPPAPVPGSGSSTTTYIFIPTDPQPVTGTAPVVIITTPRPRQTGVNVESFFAWKISTIVVGSIAGLMLCAGCLFSFCRFRGRLGNRETIDPSHHIMPINDTYHRQPVIEHGAHLCSDSESRYSMDSDTVPPRGRRNTRNNSHSRSHNCNHGRIEHHKMYKSPSGASLAGTRPHKIHISSSRHLERHQPGGNTASSELYGTSAP